LDDSGDIRSSRLGPEVSEDARDTDDVRVDACPPIQAAQHLSQLVDSQGEKKISTRSSNLDDSGDIRSSRLGPEVSEDARDTDDVRVDACPPIQAAQHLSQPVVDYRSWPHLDVTVATRLQHSSTMELGILLIIQKMILYIA